MRLNFELIKPKVLQTGDTIGIISPSSCPERLNLEKGISWLQRQGFHVVVGRHVLDQRGYLAGEDKNRAADFNEMFQRDDIDAIWCAQGGYGSMRILDYININAVMNNPKILVGYSDITGLHSVLNKYAHLVTFHGPLVAHEIGRDFTEYSKIHAMRALMSTEVPIEIKNPPKAEATYAIFPGSANGRLIGGNLSLIANMMGTPYEMDFDDRIVVLEDVSEAPYRIDRMIVQLLLAGKLQKAKGIIIGECADCIPVKTGQPSLELREVLADLITPLKIPSFYGLTIGHGTHKATFPLGVNAAIDAEAGTLTITESGVKKYD